MNRETKEINEEKISAPTSTIDKLQSVAEDVINTTYTIVIHANTTMWEIIKICAKMVKPCQWK